jgi:hypothetical protein
MTHFANHVSKALNEKEHTIAIFVIYVRPLILVIIKFFSANFLVSESVVHHWRGSLIIFRTDPNLYVSVG